jgi:Protein of unknown function (DUF4236)
MGFRMRKSIKVASGVRLNVSKSGVGGSVGGRAGRYSVHSSGRKTVSAGGGVGSRGLLPEERRRVTSWRLSITHAPSTAAWFLEETGVIRPKGREAALQGSQGAERPCDEAGGC